MKRRLYILSLLGLGLAILACSLPSVGPLQTMTLSATQVETFSISDNDHNTLACGGPCPLATMGTACEIPEPGSGGVNVGFWSSYDPGTQPCPCWEWVACAYRGAVLFDVTPLAGKGVVSAILTYVKGQDEVVSGSVASNDGNCMTQILIAGAPWSGFSTPGDAIVGAPSSGMDVSATVRDWALGKIENHGFIFAGPNESLPGETNDTCRSEPHQFQLEITFTD